jgi:hypothetical protein
MKQANKVRKKHERAQVLLKFNLNLVFKKDVK